MTRGAAACRGGPLTTTTTETTIVAERAAASVRELAQLTRPAITDLTTSDLYDLTGTLADLVAVLPQVLNQLAAYPGAAAARDCLAHANHAAAQLAVVLDTAHQTLDNTVENITTQPEGVNFQPTERGQFSAAVDTASGSRCGHDRAEVHHRYACGTRVASSTH